MEVNHTHKKLPFIHPDGNCTTTLCAIYATSLEGPWKMRSVDCGCTNNAVPYQLRNGSILMAGTCGNSHPSLHGADGEQITLAIADKNHFFGPFRKIAGQGFGVLPRTFSPHQNYAGSHAHLFGGSRWISVACGRTWRGPDNL
eukprot:COSAG01_NODE_311_length_19072_cov_73.511727_17_plen_143_part_00